MSEIDQQFIEYVVKSLVGKPEAVHIDRRIDEKGVLLELTVDPEDLGRVIGKRGATAQSLRTLLRALGTKNDARYNLKIIDNGPPGAGGQSQRSDQRDQRTDDSSAPPSQPSDDKPADDAATASDAPEPAQPVAADDTRPATDKLGDEPSEDSKETPTSDRLRQTRAELADLDDLDV